MLLLLLLVRLLVPARLSLELMLLRLLRRDMLLLLLLRLVRRLIRRKHLGTSRTARPPTQRARYRRDVQPLLLLLLSLLRQSIERKRRRVPVPAHRGVSSARRRRVRLVRPFHTEVEGVDLGGKRKARVPVEVRVDRSGGSVPAVVAVGGEVRRRALVMVLLLLLWWRRRELGGAVVTLRGRVGVLKRVVDREAVPPSHSSSTGVVLKIRRDATDRRLRELGQPLEVVRGRRGARDAEGDGRWVGGRAVAVRGRSAAILERRRSGERLEGLV